MPRSKTYSVRCVEPGCREVSWHEYERVTDRRVTDWRCWRHRNPEQILGADRPMTTGVLTVVAESYGQFWHDGRRNTSALVSGPGFKADANDFPPGTTLTVTAVLVVAASVGAS